VTQAQYIVTELSVNHIDRSENPSSICRVDWALDLQYVDDGIFRLPSR
jgi:hypothetical protein